MVVAHDREAAIHHGPGERQCRVELSRSGRRRAMAVVGGKQKLAPVAPRRR
jgi:hypothetical protein